MAFALMGWSNAWAYDKAVSGQTYYGSKCEAYGLEDGTVAISAYYLADEQTDVVFPATIQIWTTEEPYEMTAEYEVSSVGYQGWDLWFGKDGALATITSMTIPEGVKIINANCWGATSLTKLVLPSTLTEISKESGFGGATALTRIECNATTPPTLASELFDWSIFSGKTCSALVPDGAAAAYNTGDWTYWQEMYRNSLVYEASYPSITTAGWGTYYNTYGYVMPKGVEGWLVNWTYDGKANLVKVYNPGDEVVAGIALLWKSTEDLSEETWYTVEALSSGGATAAWPVDGESKAYKNLLCGSQTSAQTTAWGAESSDYYYYKLSYDYSGNNLGWYWAENDGATFTSGAHKAWLVVSKSADVKAFIPLFSDDATGLEAINNVNSKLSNGKCFDLSGRQIENGKLPKGIFIQDGKKFINK